MSAEATSCPSLGPPPRLWRDPRPPHAHVLGPSALLLLPGFCPEPEPSPFCPPRGCRPSRASTGFAKTPATAPSLRTPALVLWCVPSRAAAGSPVKVGVPSGCSSAQDPRSPHVTRQKPDPCRSPCGVASPLPGLRAGRAPAQSPLWPLRRSPGPPGPPRPLVPHPLQASAPAASRGHPLQPAHPAAGNAPAPPLLDFLAAFSACNTPRCERPSRPV